MRLDHFGDSEFAALGRVLAILLDHDRPKHPLALATAEGAVGLDAVEHRLNHPGYEEGLEVLRDRLRLLGGHFSVRAGGYGFLGRLVAHEGLIDLRGAINHHSTSISACMAPDALTACRMVIMSRGPMPSAFNPLRKAALAAFVAMACIAWTVTAAAQSRIKDIVEFEGVRDNPLIGYGLVVGLNGTGDTLSSNIFTKESLIGMLERLGIRARDDALDAKNVAAVMVTATLPPFARQGSTIDVGISALGNSTSLLGGTLLVTPLLVPTARSMSSHKGLWQSAVSPPADRPKPSSRVCPRLPRGRAGWS